MHRYRLRRLKKNREKFASAKRHNILTTKEACEYLRISKPTLLKYVRFGKIKAAKAGRGWRITLSELNRFIKAG